LTAGARGVICGISRFSFSARYHDVPWAEIRRLLIDAWRNLDPDRDFYGFGEYHGLGVSRARSA